MILAINTETFLGISYDEAVGIIKSLGGNVKMLVTSPREEEEGKTAGGADARQPLRPRREQPAAKSEAETAAEKKKAEEDRKKAAKAKEDETRVELVKDGSGFGFSIVGGTDTPLVGVFVQELHPGGPAEKSGKLRPGDRILKVNEVDFSKVTHTQAQEALRGAQDKVTVCWERTGEGGTTEDITVTIARRPGRGLGLSVVGRRDGPGVYISALVPGGVAEGAGSLHHGDQIIKVNDRDLTNSTQ